MLRTKRFKKGMLIVLAMMLVVVLAAGCGKKGDKVPGAGEGKVIATYKDGTVTDTEFNKYTTFFGIVNPQTAMYLSIPQLKEQFLREYVGYKILNARMPKPSKEEQKKIDDNTNQFYTQVKTAIDQNEELKKTLDAAKLSEADIKHFFSMITSIMSNEEKNITEDDMKKHMEESKDDYNRVTVRHILVSISEGGEKPRTEAEALKRAQEVKTKLEAGGDWNALAKEYSDDPGSKDNGGIYEKQLSKGWVAEFKDAANKQEIGKVGEPVKTQFGYHVMKVESRELATFDSLTEEEKTELKQTVASDKMNKFMTDELPGLITKIDLPKEEETKPEDGKTNEGKTNDGKADESKTNDGGKQNEGKTNDGKADEGAAKDEKK